MLMGGRRAHRHAGAAAWVCPSCPLAGLTWKAALLGRRVAGAGSALGRLLTCRESPCPSVGFVSNKGAPCLHPLRSCFIS